MTDKAQTYEEEGFDDYMRYAETLDDEGLEALGTLLLDSEDGGTVDIGGVPYIVSHTSEKGRGIIPVLQ